MAQIVSAFAALMLSASLTTLNTYTHSWGSILVQDVILPLRKNPEPNVADVCASFQEAVVDVLVGNLIRAAAHCGVRCVSASGGVSLNGRFRERLEAECDRRGWELRLAPATLCTDNAAMIAALAFHRLAESRRDGFGVDVAPSCGLEART
jgi:tRNA A37 threonylcarbamoyltransferase TsaD